MSVELRNIIEVLFDLYAETFPNLERIPAKVTLTYDLNKTHAEIRPDMAEIILKENIQSDYNGRMVAPKTTDGEFYILLNAKKVEEYTLDGSMTWLGTLAHEYTHAIDFYQMARLEKMDAYSDLENTAVYMMFQQWTEYHARKNGYRFLRKYFENTGQMLEGDEQLNYIIRTEAPMHTRRFNKEYNSGTPNERMYLTMQYLGRFSVWMDMFPEYFNEKTLLNYCPGIFWMRDILLFLRQHETLESIHGNFDELKGVLSGNWTFES